MTGVHRLPAVVLFCVAAATAAGCGSASSGAAHPTPPPATVTTTVTTPPSAPGTAPATPSPVPSPTRQPAERDAAMIVSAYFSAIDAHDYKAAWDLGGRNLSPSYAAFVRGFATTEQDIVRFTDVSGSTVTLTLSAVQTDGSVTRYAGTYTVSGGVIVSANVRQTGRSQTSPPPQSGSFANCAQARAHGRHDIPATDPAYRPHLDRDHDGIACETRE